MKRSLNSREKRLLMACLLTIFIVINFLAYRTYSTRNKSLNGRIQALDQQSKENRIWLDQKAKWQKRSKWLQANMSYTESAGRSQGQLLDELQTSALDAGLKVSNPTLLEPTQVATPKNPDDIVCNEVAVSLRVRGDQNKLLNWLLTLQSPERFRSMKGFEIELDTKAKEKIPQAQCNITLARWFNPVAPPGAPPPDATPAVEPAVAPVELNPLTAPTDFPAPAESTTPAPATAPAPAPAPAPPQQS